MLVDIILVDNSSLDTVLVLESADLIWAYFGLKDIIKRENPLFTDQFIEIGSFDTQELAQVHVEVLDLLLCDIIQKG